jgi:beta-mannosidase
MRAGLLPDLFWGTNPLLAQKEENKHLWYVKRFSAEALSEGEAYLRFEGIDTYAEVYLNGKRIGTCDNMLIEHEFPAVGLRAGENELMVHIEPTAIRARDFEGGALWRGMRYNEDSIFVAYLCKFYQRLPIP